MTSWGLVEAHDVITMEALWQGADRDHRRYTVYWVTWIESADRPPDAARAELHRQARASYAVKELPPSGVAPTCPSAKVRAY